MEPTISRIDESQTLDAMIQANPEAYDFSSVQATPEQAAQAELDKPADLDTMLGDYIPVRDTGLYVRPLKMAQQKALIRFQQNGPGFEKLAAENPMEALGQITALMLRLLVVLDPREEHPLHKDGFRPATEDEIDNELSALEQIELVREFTGLGPSREGDSKN